MHTPRDEAIALSLISAVLETVAEHTTPVPLSPIYLAFQHRGLSLDTFELVIQILVTHGLATRTSETISLTKQGRETAMKLLAAMN